MRSKFCEREWCMVLMLIQGKYSVLENLVIFVFHLSFRQRWTELKALDVDVFVGSGAHAHKHKWVRAGLRFRVRCKVRFEVNISPGMGTCSGFVFKTRSSLTYFKIAAPTAVFTVYFIIFALAAGFIGISSASFNCAWANEQRSSGEVRLTRTAT